MSNRSLVIVFSRTGREPERLTARDGVTAVSTAMKMLALKDELHAGDSLVIERDNNAVAKRP
jgi:hypothetical protein